MKKPDQPLDFHTRADWRAWLQENHAGQKEAWLVILRSHAARPGIYYEEAVEEALCFGWIDGVMNSAAAEFYYLRFSPRKRGSIWSVSNQKRVEQLIAQGKMAGAGMEKVREAQESGEWLAAIQREDPANLPSDLREALEGNAAARIRFEQYPASQKKQLLYWITSAKTTMTRQKRIQQLVNTAAQNRRPGDT